VDFVGDNAPCVRKYNIHTTAVSSYHYFYLKITHSHGSAKVVMATKQVNGKGQNSTHGHAKTPQPIFTKTGTRDYFMDGTPHAKFCSDRFSGFCSVPMG